MNGVRELTSVGAVSVLRAYAPQKDRQSVARDQFMSDLADWRGSRYRNVGRKPLGYPVRSASVAATE